VPGVGTQVDASRGGGVLGRSDNDARRRLGPATRTPHLPGVLGQTSTGRCSTDGVPPRRPTCSTTRIRGPRRSSSPCPWPTAGSSCSTGLLVGPLAAGRHQRMSSRLWSALSAAVPEGFEVLMPVNVRVAPGRILIPDIVVVTTPGVDVVMYDAAVVAMAVEIVSPGSVTADRRPRRACGQNAPAAVRCPIRARLRTAESRPRRPSRHAGRIPCWGDRPLPTVGATRRGQGDGPC